MTRNGDLPQTVGEASACDWRWLTIECRKCRRRGELKLAELSPTARLAVIARKLRCAQCQSPQARVLLGTYISDGAQPRATYRRIAFDGDHVVPPLRD